MRATLDREAVTLPPGVPVRIPLEVTNTLEVIDGISVSVDFGPGMHTAAEPPLLPLFPEDTGTITLRLTVSRQVPAGTYELPVGLRSAAAPDMDSVEHLTVVVPPEPDATVTVLPAVGVARRRATFRVLVDNTGNVPLEMRLGASDPDHAVRTAFAAPVLPVQPGQSAETVLTTSCRRRLFGAETAHQIALVATSAEVEVDTKATFRHRPLIPRGARTVMILAAIVAVWAGIFVFALDKALANDPLTKAVPASFYAASPNRGDRSQLSALGQTDSYGLASSGAAPAGAVPKSGIVIGVGGTISGTVDARSTSAGIGRITVEAIRRSTHGPVLVSSAATGSDGTYSLPGLLPGRYELRFSATGYRDVWWPHASSATGARPVDVDALGQTPGIDAVVTGAPGSISGTVETGQSPSPPVTVTVQPEQGSTTHPIATVRSDASGRYVIPDLPTPGVYDLSFSAAGYQVGTDNEELTGGQDETANTVVLTAATGTLSGTVTDGARPVGGVAITASADGQTFTSATPTSGAVGQFTLSDLPTPATYLVTFSKAGYGSRSIAEILGPGQSLTTVAVSMSGGAGDVDGQVDADGVGLGGVTVTVNGTSHPVSTQTLTAGDVGGYALSGLSTPSDLTLTFSRSGFQSQTVEVELGSSGAAIVPTVELQAATGTVTGSVSGTSGPMSGVTVSITNGTTTTTTTTSSSPAGGFTFTGLAAGSYSVSFSDAGYATATVTVPLTADETTPAVVVTLRPDKVGD